MGSILKEAGLAFTLLILFTSAGIILGVWVGIIASIAVPVYNFLSPHTTKHEQKEGAKNARSLHRIAEHGVK